MSAERKEWVSVKSSPGGLFITCSLVEENLSAKSTIKAYRPKIADGVKQARQEANAMLDELMEVMTE